MIPQVRPFLGPEEESAVAEVIRSAWLTEGPKCEEFKARLLELIGAPYGVFAPNGTLALALGMMALGIGPRDEVIVPDLTMAASAFAVLLVGARPVFVDVNPDTLQIDLDEARWAASHNPRIQAIMPVHLFGDAAPVAFSEFRANQMKIIEDACQGIGVRRTVQPYGHVGTFGDVGCFSFFADKAITTGEGGFVICKDAAIYEHLRLLRNQGRLTSGTFTHPAIGYNFRITEMQAAIGLCQLRKLDQIIEDKIGWLHAFQAAFARIPQITTLPRNPDVARVPFRCVIFCDEAEELCAYLRANGVEPRGMFAPLHSQPCFKGVLPERSDEEFPVSVAAHKRGLMLPLRPTLTEQEFEHIVKTVRDFYER